MQHACHFLFGSISFSAEADPHMSKDPFDLEDALLPSITHHAE